MKDELDITNVGTWIRDNKDKVYRILEYKKMFTPLEQEKKYIDQSEFRDDYFTFVKIVEGIEIPNDVLLKMKIVDSEDFTDIGVYLYKKISDIRIEEFDVDNEVI